MSKLNIKNRSEAIALINDLEVTLTDLIADVREQSPSSDIVRLTAISNTHFETAFMFLRKACFKI